jgi:hypothetical protein
MLVVGCTSALRVAGKRKGALAEWIAVLRRKKPERLVAVALANKLARISWAIMTTGEGFRQAIFAKGRSSLRLEDKSHPGWRFIDPEFGKRKRHDERQGSRRKPRTPR